MYIYTPRLEPKDVKTVLYCHSENKLASLEATLVRNYDQPNYQVTESGVKCRATSVASTSS